VLSQQNSLAQGSGGGVPELIDSMECRMVAGFHPSVSDYDRRSIDWLSRSIPVMRYE
jgi:hypothetical protein